MIKTIKTMAKQEKERYNVPRKVQDVIPVRRIWPDGIFLVGTKFTKTYKFTDINYLVASREDKESMFLTYSELLNSLDSGAVTKITVNNRRMNKANFEQSILMPMQGDFRDEYRREYNQMLLDKATGANGIMQEKYITISVVKKDIEEARAYFARVGADLVSHFAALGSKCVELDATERLRILHDFYRQGEEAEFRFNAREMMKRGHDFRDYICPDGIEKNSDYLKLGEKYCRVLFLKDYASYIKDNMVTELTDFNRNMMLSIDVVPVPTDEAVREVENRLLGVETNITNWQRRQNANNNFSAVVPYDMELQRKESKEFLDDLTTRDQRMMFAVITLAITADTKEQLDSDTEAVLSVARKHMCQLATLKFQQLDGLNTALPIGARKINAFRTLTTESLAVFIPFKVQEIQDKGGIYFGENAISHNLIMCNKANLLNQSAFLLGVPGAGKSFSAKELIAFLMLHPDYANDDILICDPENEFGALCQALGRDMASVIHMAAGGKDRLNAMYMVEGYGEQNPIVEKSQFIMSLIILYGKTREEVYDKEMAALEQIDSATFRRNSPTVAEYCEKWLLMQSVHVRATTLTDYTSKVRRHIIGELGEKKMAEVTLDDIQLALVPVSKKSASVYKSVVILYKSIFRAAKESHVIDTNPTIYLNAKGGGVPQEEKQALTDEQVERLLDAIRGLPPYVFVMIGLYAGLRREEILALQWDSVYLDMDAPYLTVRRAWHTEHNRPVILTELKTKAAERNIPLPDCLAECLKEAKKKSTSDYVVANRDGEPLSYTQFKRLWQYIVTRSVKERSYYRYEDGKRVKHTVKPVLGEKAAHNGKVVYSLDFDVTPHMLRHTYITNLIHSSVDPKTVQYLAGHESSRITMDIYAKVKYNRPDQLAGILDSAFAQWDADVNVAAQ